MYWYTLEDLQNKGDGLKMVNYNTLPKQTMAIFHRSMYVECVGKSLSDDSLYLRLSIKYTTTEENVILYKTTEEEQKLACIYIVRFVQ